VRVVRALEVRRTTGRTITEKRRERAEPLRGFRHLVVGLDPGREALARAVAARTRAMLERNLLGEVEGLLRRGIPADRGPLAAIGYRQAVAVLRGATTLAEAERSIVRETMRLAKRQMTWFRHQARVRWFPGPDEAMEAILAWLGAAGGEGGGGGGRLP
jgi:tRNA dimethylallyltransferase